MDKGIMGAFAGIALLLGVVAWQSVRISGLEGRLAVLETQSLDAAAEGPRRGPMARMAGGHRGGDGGGRGDGGVFSAPSGAPAPATATPDLVETVKEQIREEEMARRERGREMWVASIHEEIEAFGAEEGLTDDQIEKAQVYAEDFLLTITDFRRSIFEGEISPEAGREEMKAFRLEHEERMNELLGEEVAGRLEPRIGRGGRGR